MATGLSLHIGLNSVDPIHYKGWVGELLACEQDANDMQLIARSTGFASTLLLTKAATRKAVTAAISAAAKKLKAGDIFFLSYSGHGSQVPDVDGDEVDSLDETWCLFDGELLDDEVFFALSAFAAGVRILVLSDSCHSGTMTKDMMLREVRGADSVRYRAMPPDIARSIYLAHKAFYDKIGNDPRLKGASEKIAASALLISGCQDNQLSADGAFNGRFTGVLKSVWNGGKFAKGYRKFHRAISSRMPPDQSPNYFFIGAQNPKFEAEHPFRV